MPEPASSVHHGDDHVWRLHDGTPVVMRPLGADDRPALLAFHRALSDRSVYLRYFGVPHVEQRVRNVLLELSNVSRAFDDFSVGAEIVSNRDRRIMVGVGTLVRARGGSTAETALLVADAYQRQGLGGALLGRLIARARDLGITIVGGELLPENAPMLAVARRFGFTLTTSETDSRLVRAELRL